MSVHDQPTQRIARPRTRRRWPLMLAVCVALAAVATLIGFNGRTITRGNGGESMTQRVESTVRAGYEESLQHDARATGVHGRVYVVDAKCVMKDKTTASCIAQVDGAIRGDASLAVDVGGGKVLWRETSSDLHRAP